ncbi:hypothetical protein GCM10009122_30310 [Fulvivirga kasyanovii]|uniref:DUF3667 domain-containing protein n=1 Tax=Fulvivirga kasyanovii TaxID=396812 RepID=A0ABW9RVW9_9BACT|nr:DUF3667 domain-containing protein [Fulvivirga kasyanovii]MTI28343.1 DUF3667 domain-containing protein [Fulvivirga kasyanovii]
MICKNCSNSYEGSFCNVCGQSASVRRFNFPYFVKETFFSSLDIEKGLFYTVSQLFLRPGAAIRAYLEGKRVSLYVPVKYLLLIGALATYVSIRFDLFLSEKPGPVLHILPVDYLAMFLSFAEQYTTVINIIAIPVFALFSWLFFIGSKYNYTENLILNIYITAQQLLMLLLMFPVIAVMPALKGEVIAVYSAITLVYNFWVYFSFFEIRKLIQVVKVLLALACAYLLQFMLNYGIYLFIGDKLKGL